MLNEDFNMMLERFEKDTRTFAIVKKRKDAYFSTLRLLESAAVPKNLK
jgi:hypothetical protein